MKYLKKLLAFLVLPALIAFSGCEGSKDDATGNEAYFDGNQYSSLDRPDVIPEANALYISPYSATLKYVGQEIAFVVSEGSGDYNWTLSNYEFGQIRSHGVNSCIYRCIKVGNNDVIVTDSQGHFASAHVSPYPESLTITPSSATLSGTSRYVSFTVSGGTAPYTWTSGNASLGTISYSASSSYTAAYTASSGAYGVNTITVRDAAGLIITATVTQQ